jgi:hypothetical protein
MLNVLGRMLLIAIMCMLMIGFGVCGVYNAGRGFSAIFHRVVPKVSGEWFLVIWGALFIGIAWVCWGAIRVLWRNTRPPSSSE